MRKITWALILIFSIAPAVTAGPKKSHTYQASCQRVWAAEKIVVARSYELSKFDDGIQKAEFLKPRTASREGFEVKTTLTGSADTCTLDVSGRIPAFEGGFFKDLFGGIDQELTRGK